ncbi:methionine--tRNA ligase [Coraliomargarita akajimensis]|uniref:Methionine--tRNA ligase n=1 Tax=Coraliomargarita akajimensis (strain DSM 45221 / IAM 15411 / JCM 23193 / KCTC 12865 / 04OKA010-24) TaxID=583355 RepID=D5EQB6_CORAD|nr:methionine--tRNA ligase [Coraliomargarita akajimensis]ADE53884.1 methionyl-tRNA synthetase [Coraliomargarita akajimensis DSM 45221]
MSKKFYITTAIDYANGSPHLGHAYEKVLTDIVARYRRLMGDEVKFLTGLDEHGQKVQMSAQKEGIAPQEICDRLAVEFQGVCGRLHISNDDYIRTTQARHKKVVQEILQTLYDKGEIYKAEYSGYYSQRQEQFVTEKEKVNGEWPEIFGEVEEVIETNYFFKLAQYQEWLVDFIQSNEDLIYPRFRSADVLQFLKEPLNDLCISRPKSRLEWGIELPFDTDFVTYVWFDALTNYITAAGYGTEEFAQHWPADYHVIGKDILVPPHAVYWPIMLKALDIELPKHFLVHGWWLSSGAKMSKSTGDVVNPLDLIEQFGADAFRYFVTREMNVGQDSEFSLDLFMSRYNSDLANDLGNLVSRLLNMGGRYTEAKVPAASVNEAPEQELKKLWEATKDELQPLFESFQFHKALERIFGFISGINKYAETRAPWKLAKSEAPEDRARLETSLAYMAEALRLGVVMLTPVMPDISDRVRALIGATNFERIDGQLEWGETLAGQALGEKTILFPRPEKK